MPISICHAASSICEVCITTSADQFLVTLFDGRYVREDHTMEGVKTDEDTTKFLENMTEMLTMVFSEGKQVPAEISDTLDQILSNLSDSVNNFGSLGNVEISRSSTPPIASNGGDGLDFFDFSLYNEDDRDSD